MLKKIYFSGQINLTIGEKPNKKNVESLNLTRKENLLYYSFFENAHFYSQKIVFYA